MHIKLNFVFFNHKWLMKKKKKNYLKLLLNRWHTCDRESVEFYINTIRLPQKPKLCTPHFTSQGNALLHHIHGLHHSQAMQFLPPAYKYIYHGINSTA